MKKFITLSLSLAVLTSLVAYGAKYRVNSSGTVKTQSGQVVSSPANSVNQNYYNTYQANTYVQNNQVNDIQVGTVEIVMDYSGSMANWINVAKRSMSAIVNQISPNVRLGFRVFGHDYNGRNNYTANTVGDVKKIVKKGNKLSVITERSAVGSTSGACAATQQVSPILSANANNLISGMNSVDIGGATPMVFALDRTVNQDFKGLDTISNKKIVLITDGGENCGGDPCAFARKLMQKRSDIHIDVVLVSSSSRSLSCLSSATGGHFYTVDNLSDFSNVLTNSIQAEPTEVQPAQQNYEYIGD